MRFTRFRRFDFDGNPEPDYRSGSIFCGGNNSKIHEGKNAVHMSEFCQPLHGQELQLGVLVVIIKLITKPNSKFTV